jgi:hypothetical protein
MSFDEVNARFQEGSRLLNERRTVRPGTLRSDIPLVGPLITWGRRLWNNIAGRWYVDPLVSETNRFHEAVTLVFDVAGEQMVLLAAQVQRMQEQIAVLKQRVRF